MSKKYTWDKNGRMTSEDDGETQQKENRITEDHNCIKNDQIDINTDNIETIFNRINGTNTDPGMFTNIHLINEKLTGIAEKQKSIGVWTKAAFGTFTLLFIVGLALFIKVERFPDNFVSKSDWQEFTMTQSNLNLLLQTKDVEQLKNDEAINKQLELMNRVFDYKRATRGGETSDLKTKLPGGIDPDKLYNELMKQKEAGTDTGTYMERVNRIDPKLIK